MKNKSFIFNFMALAIFSTFIVSCEKDDEHDDHDDHDHEEELITDLTLRFTDPDVGSTTEFTFSDPDGPGGNEPSTDVISLQAGVFYTVEAEVWDKSNPADPKEITPEIVEEALEHQFFYIAESGADTLVSISYDPSNTDSNGHPIGLQTLWSVIGSGGASGEVKVVLRHQPNKSAEGVSEGNITNAGGETDVEVTFSMNIQ